MTEPSAELDLSYILPLKWADDVGLAELCTYLRSLRGLCAVLVVDGSRPELFAQHAAALPDWVVHLPVDPRHVSRNGKVAGVLTGVDAAPNRQIVVADDDVRYHPEQLRDLTRLLRSAELVRPINVFDPMPWHARWDTARTLLNLAFGSDYPGTLAFDQQLFLDAGGYAGDVLFENLELIRTLRAHGAREVVRQVPVVRRLPPSAAHFRRQRIRQAYDSQAQPVRLAAELLILPTFWLLRRRWVALATAAVLVAALGRRRVAAQVPRDVPLWAPLWLLERGVCSWLALLSRARGGVRYGDQRILIAAHSMRALQRRPRVSSRR